MRRRAECPGVISDVSRTLIIAFVYPSARWLLAAGWQSHAMTNPRSLLHALSLSIASFRFFFFTQSNAEFKEESIVGSSP